MRAHELTKVGHVRVAALSIRSTFVWAALISACSAAILFVLFPARDFPMDDDWAYARAVQDMLRGDFRIPDWAQASSMTHVAWGALFSAALGVGFNALSISNTVMGLGGLTLTYLFLCQFGVQKKYAALGAFLVALNPMYLYLSYSFMTDITFLVCCLAALILYGRGLSGRGSVWLWAGSIAAGLAFLTRQFGALLVGAVFLCLVWRWAHERPTRQTAVRQLAATCLVPVVVVLGYQLWEASQPDQLINQAVSAWRAGVLAQPGTALITRLCAVASSMALPGVLLLPTLRLTRKPFVGLGLYTLLLPFLLLTVRLDGTAFPVTGNILEHGGLIMYGYFRQPVWPEYIWTIIGSLGLLFACLSVGESVQRYFGWLKTENRPLGRWLPIPRSIPDQMLALPALFAILLVPVTILLPMQLFDRYMLPLIPLAMLVNLRNLKEYGASRGHARRWATAIRLTLAAVICIFALASFRDYVELARLRWSTAEKLVAQGVPPSHIYAGFEWIGWYLYRDGEQMESKLQAEGKLDRIDFPGLLPLNPEYALSEIPLSQYTRVEELPYTSWLSGGQVRQLIVWKRKGATEGAAPQQ